MNSRNLLEALLAVEADRASLFREAVQFTSSPLSREENPLLSTVYNQVKPLADEYLTKPIEVLPFKVFDLYRVNGSRKEFEALYFDRRRRLTALVVTALSDGVDAYLSEIDNAIWAICDEYTWCLPAHLNIHNPAAEDEAYKHVDLFAAETAQALSEICHLLQDRLDPQVVKRARREIMLRVLKPYMDVKRAFGWETATNNWSAVCAGSVGMAAIYMIEDSTVLMPIIQRVLGALDCFLEGFTEEGACLEGLGYWYYGFGYFVYFAELLKQRTGGEVSLLMSEKVRRIAKFPQFCFLQGNHVANFSDCSRQIGIQIGIFSRLCEQFEELRVPSLSYLSPTIDHCGRFATALRDLVWSNNTLLKERQGMPLRSDFLQEAQWFVSRSEVEGESQGQSQNKGKGTSVREGKLFSFAAKGGNNGEPHNHNDIGHFIWIADGVRWFEDLGAGLYTKQYFGDERYTILCNSSAGHSVPIINGCFQSEGEQFSSQVLEADRAESGDRFKLELAAAYETPDLLKLERLFELDKQHGKLSITDVYEFQDEGSSITERFVTLHVPKIVREGVIIVTTVKGQHLRMQYNAELMKATIQTADHLDHEGKKEVVYLIGLMAMDVKTHVSMGVTLEPNFEE